MTIDDNLSEFDRFIKYSKSTIALQRLVHVKMLFEVAKSIGFPRTVESVVPLLQSISSDNEGVVKQHLVEQIKHLARFFFKEGGEEGYKLIVT